MRVESLEYSDDSWQRKSGRIESGDSVGLVFVFGDTDVFKDASHFHEIKERYPRAHIVGCSSSGNISGVALSSAAIVATAISFDKSEVKVAAVDVEAGEDVEKASEALISGLQGEKLKHVIVLSDGLLVNGSELADGLQGISGVPVTGGLAGDGARFQETYIIADDEPKQGRIVAVAFYGDSLTISSGCYAGWTAFGAQRTITKSQGNIVYEIDQQPALDLYKKYLGEYASDLPNSGLRFPLSIKKDSDSYEIIRTLLAVDEVSKSITYAGDVPTGYMARLMKPNIDTLIEGAAKAAKDIVQANTHPAVALLISCVGRKIVMGQEVEEELEVIGDILGEHVLLSGFYSYGEIAPHSKEVLSCELHNQTMTLTAIYEG